MKRTNECVHHTPHHTMLYVFFRVIIIAFTATSFLLPNTVASGDAKYGFKYSAVEVLHSIYDLTREFFACYDCRY